jgi:isopenicillin N synthase-like dioxygenase
MKKLFLSLCAITVSALYAFESTIPVLHLPDFYNQASRDDFLAKMEKAASEVGFFGLTGTGVDPDLLDHAYNQIITYFDQDMDAKMRFKSINGQRGYAPGESAKDEKRVDCKEFFHVGRELSLEDLQRLQYNKNVWPDEPAQFKSSMQELYQALDSCKDAIGSALGALCQREPTFINEMIAEGDCLMRAIHYPAHPPKDAIWAGAHTDIDLFTILPRSTAKGLQVLNHEGNWIDVIVPDGAFIINCGDMLENLTNGHFKSAVHRVVDSGEEGGRYSVVFFVHPRSLDQLDPLPLFIEKTGGVRKYANVNRIELLAERLIDLGLASPQLMEFFVNSGSIEKLKEVNRFSPKAEEALQKAGLIAFETD